MGFLVETPGTYFEDKRYKGLERDSIDQAIIEKMIEERTAARKAKDWANRMEEIYLKDELWGWPDQQADQYTMARGRDSFMSCKQMDLMQYHRNLGLNNKDPVPYSPLKKFMNHLKGQKKLQGKTADDPSVFPSVKIRKEQK